MELFSVHTLLFAAKWVFVGLIYFVVLVTLVAVRREMAQRLRVGPALPSTAAGRLVVSQPGSDPDAQPGAVLHLKVDNTLGADRDNDLVLHDQFVSNRHARLRWDGAGWWLEDLGSKNGTSVNGERLAPGEARRVAPGARIQLGDMVFELRE